MPNGIEPDISLAVQGSGQQPAPLAGVSNALGVANAAVGLQSSQLTLAQQQQQFQANQRFGQIMATSSDPESAVKQMQSDPLGAYMVDALGKYTGAMNSYRSYLGQQATQNASGFTSVLGGALEGLDDPSQVAPQVEAKMKLLPPDIRSQVEPAVNAAVTSLTDGLPQGPQGLQVFKSRLAGLMVGSGAATPEMTRATTGSLAPAVVGGIGAGGEHENVQVGGGLAGETTPQAIGQAAGPGSSPAITKGPGTYEQGQLDSMNNYTTNLNTTTQLAGQQLKAAELAQEAMQLQKTGGGQSVRARLGEIAQAFVPMGLDPKVVDEIAGGNLGAAQEIEKTMVNTTMGQIQQQLPQGSHLAQREFQAFQANNPNLDTDSRAVSKIFGFWQKMYNQYHDEQSTMQDYIHGKGSFASQGAGDPTEWPNAWQDIQQKRGYIPRDLGSSWVASSNAPAPSESPVAASKYTAGQVVPGRGGKSYRFKGGDASQQSNWEPVQ